jgi:hypothetical protein
VIGRAVLARNVLYQACAPAHGVRAPLLHGEAKVVDALVLGPGPEVITLAAAVVVAVVVIVSVVWLGCTPKGGYL